MVVAKVLLKDLIVRVGAFKKLIGTFNLSRAMDDITLMANPLCVSTLFEGREFT